MAREQFYMLIVDQEAALAAIPGMLPAEMDKRRTALAMLRQVLGAAGDIAGESVERLRQVERLFGLGDRAVPHLQGVPSAAGRLEEKKAS